MPILAHSDARVYPTLVSGRKGARNRPRPARGGGAAAPGRTTETITVKGTRGRRNPALGNIANKVSTRGETGEIVRQRRAKRYGMRDGLRDFSSLARVQKCGYTPVGASGVAVRVATNGESRRAGFSGLHTCGSVWACPVCSAKIAARRSSEVQKIINAAHNAGYATVLATFTVRHNASQSLESVWDAVSVGWKRIISGRRWNTDKKTHGIGGFLKSVEITQGKNGWHVHIHVLFLMKTAGDTKAFEESVFGRWVSGIESVGFDATRENGIDVVVVTPDSAEKIGVYLTKNHVAERQAAEMTLGVFKEGRKDNRTPFQLLELAIAGDVSAQKKWAEYEKTSRGRKQMTVSQGVKDILAVEITDDETAAAEDDFSEINNVVIIPNHAWNKVQAQASTILDVVETAGVVGLVRWLDGRGIRWLFPPGDAGLFVRAQLGAAGHSGTLA